MGSIDALARTLGYRQGDSTARLEQALRSASAATSRDKSNNGLAWLGDAVVDLIVSRRIFLNLPEPTLQALHDEHQRFVPGGVLANAAIRLGLHRFLEPALNEDEARVRSETMEAAFEAIVAAVYLDKDFAAAERFVNESLGETPPAP